MHACMNAGDRQLLNKWLMLQSRADLPGAAERVELLMDHPDFDVKNPNAVRCVEVTLGVIRA